MNARDLAALDADVEEELAMPENPSRATIALDGARRDAAEKAKQATGAERYRVVNRGSFTVGRVWTQEAREVVVDWVNGTLAVRDAATTARNGVLFTLTPGHAAQLADVLREALEDLNTAPRGLVGRVGSILVERTATGVMVRDNASHRLQVNGDQAAQLVAILSLIGR